MTPAVILGHLSAAFVAACLLIGPTIGGSEPFQSVAAYAGVVLRWTGGCTFVLAIPAVLLAIPTVRNLKYRLHPTPRWRAGTAAVFLTPVTLILPAVVWSGAAALDYARQPSFGLIAGKPAWIMSPVIPLLSSAHWLWAGAAAAFVLVIHALNRLSSMPLADDQGLCPACGYDLAGLPAEAACPECGKGAAGAGA